MNAVQAQYGASAKGSIDTVPEENIQDISLQSISGLHELHSALTALADRVVGSVPEVAGKSPNPNNLSLMDNTQEIRRMTSACHSQLSRIIRVL